VRVSMHNHKFSIAILHKVLNKYEGNGIQSKHSLNFDHSFCEPASDHVTQCDKDWSNWSLHLWNSETVSMQEMLSTLTWCIQCTWNILSSTSEKADWNITWI
jgi:hypothetical protein